MNDSGEIEILCGPCSKTRVSVRATQYCATCKEPFCDNCTKFHRATPWAQNHGYVSLVNDLNGYAADFSLSPQAAIGGVDGGKSKAKMGIYDVFSLSLKNIKDRAVEKKNEKKSRWDSIDTGKLAYMERLATQHDHYQMELENELFCEQHQVIVCDLCKSKEHRNCTKFIPIEEAAKAMRKSEKAMDIVTRVKLYHKFAGMILEDRRKEENFLEKRREDILPRFRLIRQRFEEQLLMIEKKLMVDFDAMHETNLRQLSQEKEKCMNLQKLTTADIQEMKKAFCNPDDVSDSSFIKSFVKISDKCPVYESFLKELYDGISNHDYSYKLEESMLEQAEKLETIGSVEQIDCYFRLPPFLSFDDPKAAAVRDSNSSSSGSSRSGSGSTISLPTMKRPKSVYAFAGESLQAAITAIACLSNGDTAVINKMEIQMKIFHENTKKCTAYEFSSSPWDIAVLPDDHFAVTIPGNNEIQILQLVTYLKDVPSKKRDEKPQKETVHEIKHIKSLKCKGECWGITYCSNSLYATFDCYIGNSSIKRIDMEEGDVDMPVDLKVDGFQWKAPQHIACNSTNTELYATDSENHCVIGMDLEGNLKFCYTSRDLGCPTGISVDRTGNIYVAAKDTSTIHKISSDGKSGDVILSEMDGISHPRALCYKWQDGSLLTANINTSKLKAYPMLTSLFYSSNVERSHREEYVSIFSDLASLLLDPLPSALEANAIPLEHLDDYVPGRTLLLNIRYRYINDDYTEGYQYANNFETITFVSDPLAEKLRFSLELFRPKF